MKPRVGIIGAGPAGLTAAYRLQQLGAEVTVFEASDTVGGMARSFDLWGQRVDLGPHRFFSGDARVNGLWHEVLEHQYRIVARRTRIYYRRRFFDYPLRVGSVIANLSLVELVHAVASYARERLMPELPPGERDTFEAWVVHNFGRRLYEIFFKSYSEKLWGIPCDRLDADFAAQRIKKFSLGQSMLAALHVGRRRHKTLVDEFSYPKRGSGDLYERMARAIAERGGSVRLSCPADQLEADGHKVTAIRLSDGSVAPFDHIVSTMPLTVMVRKLRGVPPHVAAATAGLRFRNTLVIYLKVESCHLFEDQWLYIHSEDVAVGRITNFRNWVPELYGESDFTILAMEYWCYDEDAVWSAPDDALIARAQSEARDIGLLGTATVSAGHVVRVHRCYPVYSRGYREALTPIIDHLRNYVNLWPIGRYGSFKYNNQDHSILMGILAAENICGGKSHDLWSINTDYDSYQESADAPGATAPGAAAPGPLSRRSAG
jgi:protoporphyrinogen oxidase